VGEKNSRKKNENVMIVSVDSKEAYINYSLGESTCHCYQQ